MEELIIEMLDGRILLGEALSEFEKIYIQNALRRNGSHLSNTAECLGIHRNTLSKRIAEYSGKSTTIPAKSNGKVRTKSKGTSK